MFFIVSKTNIQAENELQTLSLLSELHISSVFPAALSASLHSQARSWRAWRLAATQRSPGGGSGGGGVWSGRLLAVRGHEDDKLGCHSPTLFLIHGDVPRWTSAQPGLSGHQPRLSARMPTQSARSCFGGGDKALLAPHARLPSFGCRCGAFRACCSEETATPLCVSEENNSKFAAPCQLHRQPPYPELMRASDNPLRHGQRSRV